MLTAESDISYWKHEVGSLGFAKEIGGAIMTGGVANIGVLRQLKDEEVTEVRSKHGTMSS